MRKLRVLKNYSQEYVAECIKIDASTYARYEKGETQIRFDQVVLIADLYGLSLDEFYHYEDPNYKPRAIGEVEYSLKKRMMISIELDGKKATLEYWIDKIRKVNAALA